MTKRVLKIAVTPVYAENLKAKAMTVCNEGGAGSSKTTSLIQLFIKKLNNQEEYAKRLLICRKTMKSLRASTYLYFIDWLKKYGIYHEAWHNKSENYYIIGKNRVDFGGMDDPEKWKSTEFDDIWYEEATEGSKDDYLALVLRLNRAKRVNKEKPRIYLSYNPCDYSSWLRIWLPLQKDVNIIKSTFRDNPFCSQEYINQIESLRDQDPNFAKIYADGEWAALENLIFTKYQFMDMPPFDRFSEVVYGMDFGFNSPTAMLQVGWIDGRPYLSQKIYQSHLQTPDIISILNMEVPRKTDVIWADSEDPRIINEIYQAGFNIHPVSKGPGSVKRSIDCVKRYPLQIDKTSSDLFKEITGYSWKKDKNGNILDEPVKFNDHLMDCLRYAFWGRQDLAEETDTYVLTEDDLSANIIIEGNILPPTPRTVWDSLGGVWNK